MGFALVAALAATLWAAQLEENDERALADAGEHHPVPAPGRAAPKPLLPGASTDWQFHPRQEWRTPSDTDLAAWMMPSVPLPSPAPPAPPPQALLPPAPPSPPPPPVAPPFPYQLLGQMTEGNIPQVLISTADRLLTVKAGDVIDGQWKVEQVSANGMDLLWQPAQLRQTVSFRSAQ